MKLCIITSCLNEYGSIKEHIEYLNNLNTLHGIIYIICDGGSTDGSIRIIESIHQDNCFLIKNSGTIYNSWNEGIRWGLKLASHFVFLGVGDRLDPIYLRNTIMDPNHNASDICFSGLKIGHELHAINSYPTFQRSVNSIFACMPLHHVGTIFSSRLFKLIGAFNIEYKIAADLDWVLRLRQIKNLILVSSPRYGVYMKPGGISSGLKKPFNIMVEELKIALQHKLLPCPKRVFYLLFMIFKNGLRKVRYKTQVTDNV